MPPPAELWKRPQDGISRVQKVAAVELGFVVLLDVWGYVDIYRRKKYVGGAAEGPRGWRARQGGRRAPLPRAFLPCFLTPTLSLLDHVC